MSLLHFLPDRFILTLIVVRNGEGGRKLKTEQEKTTNDIILRYLKRDDEVGKVRKKVFLYVVGISTTEVCIIARHCCCPTYCEEFHIGHIARSRISYHNMESLASYLNI